MALIGAVLACLLAHVQPLLSLFRDVSYVNIMAVVPANNDLMRFKLIDLGLGRQFDDNIQLSVLTP